jgi:hypothetical protein
MKNSFLTIMLIALVFAFLSCKKNENYSSIKSANAELSKNNGIITTLIKGGSSSNKTSSSSRIVGGSTSSGYSVSLANGMLVFDSPKGMLNFLDAMDVAIANWDTDADPELQGLPSEKNISGDPTKNAFDSAMGFSSLRKKYEMAYYDNPDFKSKLLVNINEEDTRTILNENNEVQIGTTIYKFMGENVIAEILNQDYKTLQFLRDHPGLVNSSPNLTLKNANSGVPLRQTDVNFLPLGECIVSAFYTITEKYQGDYRKIQLTIIPKAEKDGSTAFCGYTYYVKWGDGFETSPVNFSAVVEHTYNVNLTPGQCQAFSISIKVTAISCSITDCQNRFVNVNASTNICNPIIGCGKNTTYRESDPSYFIFGGINYRIIGGVGAQHATSWWPRRNMIYSRTFWQKLYSNGNWLPTKNRKVHLTARVYGPIFLNQCTTVSQRDGITTKRNQVHVETNDYISPYYDADAFGYTTVDPNVIKSDHYIFIDIAGGFTASIIGHKLQ